MQSKNLEISKQKLLIFSHKFAMNVERNLNYPLLIFYVGTLFMKNAWDPLTKCMNVQNALMEKIPKTCKF